MIRITEAGALTAAYIAVIVSCALVLGFGVATYGRTREAQDCAIKAGHVFITDTRQCLALPGR